MAIKTRSAHNSPPLRSGWISSIPDAAKTDCGRRLSVRRLLALDGANPATRTGSTDKHLVANVFYFVSTGIVAKAAKVLGEEALAKEYADRAEAIRAAFRTEYFTATGRLVSETQTACVLTLYFGLVPEGKRERVIETLRTNLSEHNNHLVTGFAGTPYLLFALSENGMHDLAEKLLFHEDFPSWLYAVKMGATTIWERWDGILPDGSLHEPSMNSFNHYSYGSVGDWLYRVVAGIRETSPRLPHLDACAHAHEGARKRPCGV